MGRFSTEQLDDYAATFDRDGIVVLRRHFPKATLLAWRDGRLPLHAITMELGDVMIRDVRALHRGTPNRTELPRPMVVIGYSRSWYFRPEVRIDVPDAVYQQLAPRAKCLLRHMPRVNELDNACAPEQYRKFAY